MEAPCPQAPVAHVGAPAPALGRHQPSASPAAVHLPAPSEAPPGRVLPTLGHTVHTRAHTHIQTFTCTRSSTHTRVCAHALVHSRAPAQHARLKTSTRSHVPTCKWVAQANKLSSHLHARVYTNMHMQNTHSMRS